MKVVILATVGWTGKISEVTNPTRVMGVATTGVGKVKGLANRGR